MTLPRPAQTAPKIDALTMDGRPLPEHQKRIDGRMQVVIFYRGVHCPVCKKQLTEFQEHLDAYTEKGASVLAVSMDSEERARRSIDEWKLDRLTLARGLTEASGREWGLYFSDAIKDAEPARFSEPGVALILPDGTLYQLAVQSSPFGRIGAEGLLKGVEFALEKDYPPRGTA